MKPLHVPHLYPIILLRNSPRSITSKSNWIKYCPLYSLLLKVLRFSLLHFHNDSNVCSSVILHISFDLTIRVTVFPTRVLLLTYYHLHSLRLKRIKNGTIYVNIAGFSLYILKYDLKDPCTCAIYKFTSPCFFPPNLPILSSVYRSIYLLTSPISSVNSLLASFFTSHLDCPSFSCWILRPSSDC